jgi:hypothetical protein
LRRRNKGALNDARASRFIQKGNQGLADGESD